jgi:hypothetical protein
MDHLSPILDRQGEDHVLEPMLWRLDQLDRASWRDMALADAARASAIVVALSSETPMDSTARSWLTTLAATQRDTGVRVLTLIDDEVWTISLEPSADPVS